MTLATLSVVLVAFIAAGAILLRGIDRAAHVQSLAQATLLAQTLAGSFSLPLARNQHEVIQRLLDQVAEMPDRFPDVVSVAVVDQSGRIVAHTDSTRFGEQWGRPILSGEQISEDDSGGTPIILLAIPIESAVRFGTLEISVAVRGPREAARAASKSVVIALGITLVAIVLALSFLIDRLVVRPLRRLARAVAAFGGNQKTLGVPVEGPPEVQTLVKAFNEMAGRLHEYTGSLEVKVEERTRELRGAYDRLTIANYQLQELAVTDGLTGLSNRRAFSDRLGLEVERSRREGEPLSLILFDLDNFKRLNDSLGHLEGDAALVLLAGILREGRRSVDLVARFGGEEFVLLLPGTAHGDAVFVADRLRAATAAADLPGHCTVSGGVATLPDQAEDARALIAAADHALYAAKDAGRNRVLGASAHGTMPMAAGAK